MGRQRRGETRPLLKDQHGTASCYVMNKCRCELCTKAVARGNKVRKLHGANLIDATAVKEHITYLSSNGVGAGRIAELIGTTKSDVQHIRMRTRIRPEKAAAILAITPANGSHIDSTGTRRRIQALIALGWTHAALGEHHGKTRQNLTYLMRSKTVHHRTAARIRAMYDELAMTPGPSPRARENAARNGWPPPLAWDDDTIDDPAATPSTGEPDGPRRDAGGLAVVENYHDTWDAHGGDYTLAAQRLGITRNALEMALSRARRSGIDVRPSLVRAS